MLLEAKIGSYKIYDEGIRSLIDENGWVTDEVRFECMQLFEINSVICDIIGDHILSANHGS